MAGDIEIDVAHSAPLLLAGRRGAAPRFGVTDLVTRVRIPTLAPETFAERRTIASYEFAVRDGRLWRTVQGYRPDPKKSMAPLPAPIDRALDALRGTGDGDIRREFHRLHLDPSYTRNQYGQFGPWPTLAARDELDPGLLRLDLRAEAAAALTGRIGRDLASDGVNLWTAVPPPELHAGEKPVVRFKAIPMIGHQETHFPCPPDATGLHVAFMRRNRFRDRNPATYPKRLRAEGEGLLRALEGVGRDPLAEIDLFVRRFAPIAYQVIDGPFMFGDYREPMRALLSGLMPLFVRAAAGLIPREGLGEAVDRLAGAVAEARATVPRQGSGLGASTLDHILHYVEEVARPRLAAQPVDALDADALGALSR